MNFYDILGVSQQATQQEIKSAYRKLAMEHHPDRGGDESKFQKINQAYATLSDPNLKNEYDQRTNGQSFGNFRSFEDINEVFNDFFQNSGFGFARGFRSGHGQTRARNHDLNIKCQISLLDSYIGKNIETRFNLPSGKTETIQIALPPGIEHGDTLKFKHKGDDTYPQVPRGDLNITIFVNNDPNFGRKNNDLTTIIEIDPIEAMIGCIKPIECIDGKKLQIRIPPGTNYGEEIKVKGMGFSNIKTGYTGDFVIINLIKIPKIRDEIIKKKLEEIKNAINNLPK